MGHICLPVGPVWAHDSNTQSLNTPQWHTIQYIHRSHSFTDKNAGLFQDLFGACECLNIREKRHLPVLTIFRV